MNLLKDKLKKEKGIALTTIIIIIAILIIIVAIVIILLLVKPKNTNSGNQENDISSNESNDNTNLEWNAVPNIPTKITGSTPYLPTGFSKSLKEGEKTLEEGLVIKDADENEYVWIPVPNDDTGPNYFRVEFMKEDSIEYYQEIENSLLDYTDDIIVDEYEDDFLGNNQISESIFEIADYNSLKKKMLKSIYKNGGFYIGRYEVGYNKGNIRGFDYNDEEYERLGRQLENMTANDLKQINEPVIKKDAYPYNWISCKQAEGLAEKFASGEYNSTLMFGIQWKLVLKFLQVRGNMDVEFDKSRGNTSSNSFTITSANAKQTSEEPYIAWNIASKSKEGSSDNEKAVLLTTGASEANKCLNIYDITGNVAEYTLQYEWKGKIDPNLYGAILVGGSFIDWFCEPNDSDTFGSTDGWQVRI